MLPPPLREGVDYQALLVGLPGSGKSTLQRAIARQWANRGAFVLVHDEGRDWENEWPGIKVMRSVGQYHDAVRAGKVPRYVAAQFSSSELVDLVEKIGCRWNTKKNVRFPMLLAFDEATLVDGSGETFQGDGDRRLCANRRHWGAAVCWNAQGVTQLPVQFWRFTTDVYMYRVEDLDDVRTIAKRCNVARDSASFLQRLELYRHAHIRRVAGGGFVREAL